MVQFIQGMLGLGVLSSKASPGNPDPSGTIVQVPSKVRPSCASILIRSPSYFLRDCEKIKPQTNLPPFTLPLLPSRATQVMEGVIPQDWAV